MIRLVQSKIKNMVKVAEAAGVAVVVSIARGHDASYPFRTIGAADGGTFTGDRGAGYYLSAVEKGGEPAGMWVGNGAAELGFRDGDTVRREDFEPLYGQFLDPRDPSGRTYLGSPPRVNAELRAIYQAKLAARPGATADERMRLLTEARAEYEGPVGVQYFDTTFSVDKTISLAHASALASAREAQQAGDARLAGQWEARAAGIWAEIEKSVRLYIAHMQREARFVRTGHHGRRTGGLEAGLVSNRPSRCAGNWTFRVTHPDSTVGATTDRGPRRRSMTTTNEPQGPRQPSGADSQATSQPGGPRRCPAQTRSLGSGRWRFPSRLATSVPVVPRSPAAAAGPGSRDWTGSFLDPALHGRQSHRAERHRDHRPR